MTLLLLLSLLGGNALCQTLKQTVKGTITDVNTGLPIPGATVVIVGSQPLLGAATDEQGNFRIMQVPIGRHTLRVTMLGYSPQIISDVLVGSGKQTDMTLTLAEDARATSEVVVTDNPNLASSTDDMNLVSARTFSPEEMRRYAGTINDPARMATAFPGAQGSPSGSNDILVRGNSPRGMLYKLEGMEMPNPNHFTDEGASGGAISALNPNVLRSSDFLTGAFSAQYGNATSGVFDLYLRKGNTEKKEYTAQIGVLGTELQAEGPLNKKAKQVGSYVANYRYSTLGLLNATGLRISGDAEPTFQDGVFKIWIPTAHSGAFILYGLGAYNTVTDVSRDFENIERDKYKGRQGRFTSGLKHTLQIGKNLNLESQINASGTVSDGEQNGNPYKNSDPFTLQWKEKNIYINYRAATTLLGKINALHSYRTGFIASVQSFNIRVDYNNLEMRQIETAYNQKGQTALLQSFVAWQYRATERLVLIGGLHQTYFALNKQFLVEPRLSASYQASSRHTFTFGTGLHSRADPPSFYFANIRQADGTLAASNKNLGINRSLHIVGGHLFAIKNGLSIKTEAYYQHLFQVPVGVDSNAFYSVLNSLNIDVTSAEQYVNKGKGRNYGVDLGLQKAFARSWYFSVTQSVFRSEYKNPGLTWAPSRYDNHFVTNFLGGKEYTLKSRTGKERKLLTNFRLIYTGGYRYTPVDVAQSEAQSQTVLANDRYNSKTAPNFTRVDFSVGVRTNRLRSTHTLKLDVLNLFNQVAVVGEFYDIYEKKVVKSFSLGIVPNLSYRVEF